MTFAKLFSHPSVVANGRLPDVMKAFEEIALATMQQDIILDEILLLLGKRMSELLEVTRCSVYVRQDDGLFRGRAGWHKGKDIGDQVRTLVAGMEEDGFTREIVQTAAPVVVTDAGHDQRTVKKAVRNWHIHAMLGVPLVVEDDVKGIIFVDNEGSALGCDSGMISVAQAFASLAAVAVHAGMVNRVLDDRAKVIDRQRNTLHRLAEVHSRLTQALLDGANLEGLASIVQELVGKPVLVYTTDFECIAWSAPDDLELTAPPVLPRMCLDAAWFQRMLEEARASTSATLVPPAPGNDSPWRRLLSCIRIDRSPAGYLEIVELGRPFSGSDLKISERAAMSMGVHLLTERRQADAEGQAQQDFLADLLHGYRSPEQLQRRAKLYGFDPRKRMLIARVTYEEAALTETGSGRRSQMQKLWERMLPDRTSVFGAGEPGADLLLLSLGTDTMIEDVEASLPSIFEEACRLGCRYILLSGVVDELDDLPREASELREIHDLLKRMDAPHQVGFARKLGMVRLAASTNGLQEAARFSQQALRPLEESGGANGQLLGTLSAYLEHGAQVRATARTLHVHENTVRYRLGRIEEVAGINLEDFEMLMQLRFALQVRGLIGSDDDAHGGSAAEFSGSRSA